VIDRGHDVAVAREVCAEKRRLAPVPAAGVGVEDERIATGPDTRVTVFVLVTSLAGRGIPELERKLALAVLIDDDSAADADTERTLSERVVRQVSHATGCIEG
jgi:hypothetical protein